MNTKAALKAAKAENLDPKKNADGSFDIALLKPLTIDGTSVKSLRMREPLVEDQLAAEEMAVPATAAGIEMTLIANLCMIAPGDLRKLTLRDYDRVQKVLMGFIV